MPNLAIKAGETIRGGVVSHLTQKRLDNRYPGNGVSDQRHTIKREDNGHDSSKAYHAADFVYISRHLFHF